MPTEPDIRTAIRKLADEGKGPPEIYRELGRRMDFEGRLPTLRTIQRMVDKLRPKDPADPWDWTNAKPDEAQAVLEALGVAIARTGGRISSISSQQAEWIVKVRSAVPQMPAGAAWWFAQEYVAAKDAAHLDAALAVARTVQHQQPGQLGLTEEQVAGHVSLHVRKWLRRDLVAWAGSKTTAELYIAEIGEKHGSLKAYEAISDDWFIRLSIESQKEDIS